MLSVRRTARWGQCLCVLLLCGGCATVRVPMTIRHPAQIDMSSYKRVAVGKFGGDMGTRFRVAMETKFAESERFELVDRKNLDQMLNELRVSYSELSELDDDQRPRLGRILAASAIISGSATSDYSEHTTSEVETNKKTGKETVVYKRVGHASVMGSLDAEEPTALRSRAWGIHGTREDARITTIVPNGSGLPLFHPQGMEDDLGLDGNQEGPVRDRQETAFTGAGRSPGTDW